MMLTDEFMLLSPKQIRTAAVVADVDPRTVQRFLAGEPIRDLCRERLERAFARLGLSLPDAALEAAAIHDRDPEAVR